MAKVWMNWSSGKDSSMALHHLLQEGNFIPEILFTTVNSAHQRVSMHGLRASLLMRQAEAIGLPLRIMEVPEFPDMQQYEKQMQHHIEQFVQDGYSHAVFGDIFLEDLRRYREEKLADFKVQCVFPLWKKDTKQLMEYFISNGFKAIVVCTDDAKLDPSFCGRELDASFLKDLPKNVDPCGENGEFHTFCYDGPIFRSPVSFEIGETVCRTYPGNPPHCFHFLDLW
jgi:uncharacterized protein (TIGR00290 family)